MKNTLDHSPATGRAPESRRGGVVRRSSSDRVRIVGETEPIDGWALNVSPGGVRVVVESPIAQGSEIQLAIGVGGIRTGRVAWVREELGGAILGVQFLDGAPISSGPPSVQPASA